MGFTIRINRSRRRNIASLALNVFKRQRRRQRSERRNRTKIVSYKRDSK